MFNKFGLGVGNTTVDVELTINGESVDFLDALHDILMQFDVASERAVLERAKEVVSSSRLDALSRKLNEFEWQIEEELNNFRK
jgi:hypothetical protein